MLAPNPYRIDRPRAIGWIADHKEICFPCRLIPFKDQWSIFAGRDLHVSPSEGAHMGAPLHLILSSFKATWHYGFSVPRPGLTTL
jgi:hypothetical protein